MKLITFISAGAFILLTAFVMKNEKGGQKKGLYDTKWVLKKMHTASGTESVDTKAFLRFNKEKNSAGGNGSCNSFGSTVQIDGNKIRLTELFSTKMYCEGVQGTEDTYFQLLEQANRYKIKDKKLQLFKDDVVLLEFVSE